jgi:hypothetical protein
LSRPASSLILIAIFVTSKTIMTHQITTSSDVIDSLRHGRNPFWQLGCWHFVANDATLGYTWGSRSEAMPREDNVSLHQNFDPVKKLAYLRPRNHKGKRESKHPLPNRDTINRQRQEKNLPEFVLDALEFGYLVNDGDGGTQRVKLENPTVHTLMELVDNGVVAQHIDRKYQSREIKREYVLRGGDGKELNPQALAQRIQDDADLEGEYWPEEVQQQSPAPPALPIEYQLLARVAAREKASAERERARKAEQSKAARPRKTNAKSAEKLKAEAIQHLMDSGKPITIEEVNAYVRARQG